MDKFKSIGKYILNFVIIIAIGSLALYLIVGKEIGSVFEAVKTAKPICLAIIACMAFGIIHSFQRPGF